MASLDLENFKNTRFYEKVLWEKLLLKEANVFVGYWGGIESYIFLVIIDENKVRKTQMMMNNLNEVKNFSGFHFAFPRSSFLQSVLVFHRFQLCNKRIRLSDEL